MATKILLISANPVDTSRLRLNEEFKRIKQNLKDKKNFQVELSLAATINDIRKDVIDHKPDILHFSGHGEGQPGLVVENKQGESQQLSSKAISNFLALLKKDIQCVLLNACYSQYQAEAIVQHIDYVIGMNDAIADEAAIEFSVAFYDSLSASESIPRAFEIACTSLGMLDLKDADTAILLKKPELQIAYQNDFQFDTFISYAPEDDDNNWVNTLATDLQAGLEKELKAESAFCYVPPSQRNCINEQRFNRIKNSLLFVAIVSPAWLDNKFCQAEFNYFKEKKPAARIILLEKTKKEQSVELLVYKSFNLWVKDKEDVITLINPDTENPVWAFQYFQKTNDCAKYFAEQLRLAKNSPINSIETTSQTETTESCPSESVTNFRVFLADNADDVMTQRDDLVRYLQQQNIKLVSQDSYFHSQPEELEKQIDADLKQAQLFVQLLSPLEVRRPPGMATPTLQLQRALALNIPVLQWHQKQCEPADLQDLMPEYAYADSLESFKSYLSQQLKIINTPKVEKPELDGRLLFINAESIDKAFAGKIGEIAEAQGLYLSYPLQEGDPEELRADLTENLLDCDGVLMLYGNSPVRWVRSQLRQAVKIARKRKLHLPFWVLCETPPAPKDDLAMPLPGFITLFDSTDDNAESLVQRLLSEWEEQQ